MNMKKLLLISMMLMTVLARYAGEDTTGGAIWQWQPAKIQVMNRLHPNILNFPDHRVGKMRMNPKFRMYLHCR